ncbi:MAG: hypothetical protein ACJ761_04320, partial [Chloroflexota bacterium]
PVVVHDSPSPALEWRLVRITGRIDDVKKLGERWRAELVVGSARVVVIGQSGAKIPKDRVTEGSMATVTGIARRAIPSASDQRFAILPRSSADLDVSPAAAPMAAAQRGGLASPGASTAPDASGAVDVDLNDLDGHIGGLVRVGGLVVELVADTVVLDDGTARGTVATRGGARDVLALVEPGDALNAIGRVERLEAGLAVVVDDPGGIQLAGALIADADASAAPSPQASDDDPAPIAALAALGGGPGPGGAGLAGGLALVGISATSLAVTLARRRRAGRLLAGRIAARLAAVVGPADVSPISVARTAGQQPPAAERGTGTSTHESRTSGSA